MSKLTCCLTGFKSIYALCIEAITALFILILLSISFPSFSIQTIVRDSRKGKLSTRSLAVEHELINQSIRSHSFSEDTKKITLWKTNSKCHGIFSAEYATDKKYNNSIPYAMVRDANIDYTATYRARSNNLDHHYVYVTFYLTTHISVRMINSSLSTSSIGFVNYIEQIDRFLNQNKTFRAGDVNKRGYSVSEYRLSIALPVHQISPNTSLNLLLPLQLFNDKVIYFKPRIHMSCVTGSDSFFSGQNAGDNPSSCLHSSDAVLFGGKAVFGNETSLLSKQLAHFVARALFGRFQFRTVVMAVNVPLSQSELQSGRKNVEHSQNDDYLENIRSLVRQELIEIGMWDRFPENGLVIIPACTLGTTTKLREKCFLSSRYGQYAVGLMLHSLFSQSYKWAVSMDMDEFVYDDSVSGSQKIVTLLDEIDRREGYRGYFTMKWFNFWLGSDSKRNLTQNLIRHTNIEITGRVNTSLDKTTCLSLRYDRKGRKVDVTGKSALRCDIGEGFKVHTPVIRGHIILDYDINDMNEIESERLVYPEKIVTPNISTVRIWHARMKSPGHCIYRSK